MPVHLLCYIMTQPLGAAGWFWFLGARLSISPSSNSNASSESSRQKMRLRCKEVKRVALTDISLLLRASLNPGSADAISEIFRFIRLHLSKYAAVSTDVPRETVLESPLRLQIRFGTHNDTWDLGIAGESDDLVIHNLDHIERITRRDRVHEDEAMDPDSVSLVEDRVFVLGRGCE